MSEEPGLLFKNEESGDLDNPLRAIIVVNSTDAPEGDLEERMLDGVQTHDEVDAFFDKFDEKVAYPNEEHIKYEVGSDGLVIFVVDSLKLKADVIAFLDVFSDKSTRKKSKIVEENGDEASGEDEDSEGSSKKKAKK